MVKINYLMKHLFLVGIFILITSPDISQGYFLRYYDRWSYEGILSPEQWKYFNIAQNECGGKRQSPINIIAKNLSKSKCTLSLINHNVYFFNSKLKNDGRTVNLILNQDSDSDLPMLEIGFQNGSATKYLFNSLHFHFGSTSDKGSEHQINGCRSPMEMHSTYYSPKYNSFDNATGYPDGIVVVATLYKISEHDNHRMWPVISKLKDVINPLSSTSMTPFILEDLIPFNRNQEPFKCESFYKYHGSFTTPPCSEAVTWFVLKNKYAISESQISEFRLLTKKMTSENGEHTHSLADNCRPTQPLNERVVYEHT